MRALFEKAKQKVAVWAAEKLFSDGTLQAPAGSSLFRLGQEGEKRSTDGLLKAFSERPYLAGPADAISTDVGCIQWKLYRVTGTGEREGRTIRHRGVQRAPNPTLRRKALQNLRDADRLDEIDDHPLLDLLYDPNPDLVGAQYLKLVTLHADLVGDAPSVIVYHESGIRAGQPAELWPIPITWLKRRGGTLWVEPPNSTSRFKVTDDEILLFRDVDPADPYGHGVGAARSVSDELDIAEYAAKELKSRLNNGSLPDFIAWLKDGNESEARRLKAQIMGAHLGPYKRGSGHFTNKEVKFEKLSMSPQDMQVKDLLPMQRDAIRMRFGVPPEILGDVKDSNRATITGATIIYMSRVVEPRMERIRQVFQQRLVPLYDDRLVLDFVSPVPEDEDFKLEVMQAAPKHFKRNEWRQLAGQMPVDESEGGEDFYGSPLMVPEGELARAVGNGREKVKLIDLSEKRRAIEVKGRFTDEDASDVFWQAVQRIADRLEPQVRNRFLGAVEAMQDAMDENRDAIIRALRSGNVEAALREIPWDVFRGRFAGAGDELRGLMLAAMEATGKLAAEEVAASAGVEIAFDIENRRAIAAAAERAATLVREISEGQRETVREIAARGIREGRTPDRELYTEIRERIGLTQRQEASLESFRQRLVEEGASEVQVARRVERQRNALMRRRATTIGRTETIWASNAGNHELIQQTVEQGIASRQSIRRFWVTTPDERLCPICEPMPHLDDNQKVGPDDVFTLGDFSGTVTHAPAHPMCRCGVGWEIEDPSAIDPDRSMRFDGLAKATARLAKEEAA